MAIERVFPLQEDWSTRQQGPPNLISANRGLWLLIGVYLNIFTTVTVLWHPSMGTKERTGMNKCVFDWWPIEQYPLRSVGPDSQHKPDRGALKHSCPELLLGKHLLGTFPFPWEDSIHILEGSACLWHVERPDQTWSIGIGTQAPYTSVLAKALLGLCV